MNFENHGIIERCTMRGNFGICLLLSILLAFCIPVFANGGDGDMRRLVEAQSEHSSGGNGNHSKSIEFFFDRIGLEDYFRQKYSVDPIKTNNIDNADVLIFYFKNKNEIMRVSSNISFLISDTEGMENPFLFMQKLFEDEKGTYRKIYIVAVRSLAPNTSDEKFICTLTEQAFRALTSINEILRYGSQNQC